MEKVQILITVLGGRKEKAEEWHTYVVDYAPRRMLSLDGSFIGLTQEVAQIEARRFTGQTPVRIAWASKKVQNSALNGSVVISFTQAARLLRSFSTISISHQIV